MQALALQPADLRAWLDAGARTAAFRAPGFDRLTGGPSPALVVGALAGVVLLAVLIGRVAVVGDAMFDVEAIDGGWWTTLVAIGMCWLASSARATTATLFALLLIKSIVVLGVWLAATVIATRVPLALDETASAWLLWSSWVAFTAWDVLAALVLLGRVASPRRLALIVSVAAAALALELRLPSRPHWIPLNADRHTESRWLRLTEEVLEAQPRLLAERLAALRSDRVGTVDVYGITFAPYAGVDVFRNESRLVVDVLESRFDAEGRTLELVNHAATATTLPWATPRHLERAIQAVTRAMNVDEDVLVLHLTSHGAADGRMSAQHWPLELDPLTPDRLRGWLDAAGIRHAVISVSACYSGTWIEPLRGEGRLVVTAADAKHTSYGCGLKSDLTFFGRAYWDEALRRTRSFEQAHDDARLVIEQRERDAGKSDGFSNPQIAVGSAIRAKLSALERELAASSAAR